MPISAQRKPLRVLILIIAAFIVAWSVYQESRAKVEVGELEYRMVSGILGGTFEVIMLETEKQFNLNDSAFISVFQINDAEIISRAEQLSLLQKYNNLQYRVNMYQNVKEEQAQFRVSREIFNQLKFNTNIKFEVDRKVQDSIVTIIEM